MATFKFNVNDAAIGEPSMAGIGKVLCNFKGKILYMFFKYVGIKTSNEAKVLVILEALRIFSGGK